MRYSPVWRSAVACLVLLALAAPASGAGEIPPWSGGTSHVTPFEAAASGIARDLAGRDVVVECVPRAEWRRLSALYGFERLSTWALTPLRQSGENAVLPTRRSVFSPRACSLAQAFALAPSARGARLCKHGYRLVRRNAAAGPTRSAGGKWIKVPLLGECDDWAVKLLAVHVVGHESMHLAGVVDEAAAECLSAQLGAFVARNLGATRSFARSLAAEYWRYYYRSQDARYHSSACRSGGALDLFPRRAGWPTPDVYPSEPHQAIDRFLATESAARSLP